MSENYRFYTEKTEARRRARGAGALRAQLGELMAVVARCERIWAIEDRIERSL